MSNQQPIHVHVHRETGCLKFFVFTGGFILFCVLLVKLGIVPKGQHLSSENYNQIHINMTLPMVEDVLGKQWKELPAVGKMRTYVFSDGAAKSITVVMVDGRVVDKSSMGLD